MNPSDNTPKVEFGLRVTSDTRNCATCKHLEISTADRSWTECKLQELFDTAPKWGNWLRKGDKRTPPGRIGETVCNWWEYSTAEKREYEDNNGITQTLMRP